MLNGLNLFKLIQGRFNFDSTCFKKERWGGGGGRGKVESCTLRLTNSLWVNDHPTSRSKILKRGLRHFVQEDSEVFSLPDGQVPAALKQLSISKIIGFYAISKDFCIGVFWSRIKSSLIWVLPLSARCEVCSKLQGIYSGSPWKGKCHLQHGQKGEYNKENVI